MVSLILAISPYFTAGARTTHDIANSCHIKIFREIKTEDRKHLQDDLDKLQQWSDTWLLKFHPRSEGEKDLGVMVDDKVNFDKHTQQQVNKANSIMGLIRRT